MTEWNPFEERDPGLPPQEVRVVELLAEPHPAGERLVRVHLQVTPFEQRPNIEVRILKDDNQVSSIHIIEAIDTRMTFTMHMREVETVRGSYRLSASLSYPEVGTVDQKIFDFEINTKTE